MNAKFKNIEREILAKTELKVNPEFKSEFTIAGYPQISIRNMNNKTVINEVVQNMKDSLIKQIEENKVKEISKLYVMPAHKHHEMNFGFLIYFLCVS
jgi:hypothetical protein